MIGFKNLIKTVCDTLTAYARWASVVVRRSRLHNKVSKERTDRNLLLLAWVLPPDISGGVYRPTSFLRYGVELGWRITAIGGEVANNDIEAGNYLLRTIPSSVRMLRVKCSHLRPSWSCFPRIDGGFLEALDTANLAFHALAEDVPDVVLASGPPFHNFVAAYYISRRFRAKLVLDYRDEWTESPFDFIFQGNTDRTWEQRCLQYADAVFFTTRSHQEHYLKVFPVLDKDKCHLVENGWERDDFETAKEITQTKHARRKSAQLILSFVGNLGSHTLPSPFLDTLEAVLEKRVDLQERILLRMVGRKSVIATIQLNKFKFQQNLERVDQVPKPEANWWMRQSDGLLIIAHPELAAYLPGKVFDYVAAQVPILVYGYEGEVSRLIRDLNIGIFVPADDAARLAEALDILLQKKLKCKNRPEVDQWLENHRRDNLAQYVFSILDSLIN